MRQQHLKNRAIAALFTLTASLAAAQQAAVLADHVPASVRSGQAKLLGSTDSNTHLQLALSLPLRNEAALDALIAQIYDPASPMYHHYLTADQFTAAYQPSQQDYDAVVKWAQAKGFAVTATTPNRHVIDLDGSIATISSAFHLLVNTYQDAATGRTFHAPDREPTSDAPLALYAISGLDDAVPRQSHYKKKPTAAATTNTDSTSPPVLVGLGGNLGISAPIGFSAPIPYVNGCTAEESATPSIKGSGPSSTYLPSDMRAAYYGGTALTGTGQVVGIFSFDGYVASDLPLYYSKTSTSSKVPVKNVLVNGFSGACQLNSPCDDGEQILDIVQVTGMAPGLTQVLFYEGTSATNVLNQMASDNTAKTLTSSWGGGDFGTASDPIFKQFQTQGQSYLNATGDSGQFNASTYDAPSLDANITQVGGTDLQTTSAGGAWSSETGWGCSGGGFYSSAGVAIPTWQQTSGVITTANAGSTSYRNAPDLAAEADFDNSTVINGAFETGYGGTSYATPRWAGYIALANQQSVANGHGTLGFLNPTLYTIGLSSTSKTNYHDITAGNNKPSAGSGSGFNAVAGYDLVTGWGSPYGATLINTLAGGTTAPTADFSLAASPTSASVAAGSSATTKVTVTDINSFTGTVAFTASGMPTGVTATFSPASSASSTTLTLASTSASAAGTYTITVTGTSGSLTHTATFALTVTTSGGAATQLITNSGFETGAATPWTLTSGVLCSNSSCSGETAHAGSYFIWLDGYGSTHTDTASQSIAITAGKSTATLAFYLHIDTAETGTTAYDKLTVQLLNSSGTVLTTLATFSNVNAATGYTLHSYNVAAYIGQTVTLKFTGTEDSSNQTSFVLDDITLTVQ